MKKFYTFITLLLITASVSATGNDCVATVDSIITYKIDDNRPDYRLDIPTYDENHKKIGNRHYILNNYSESRYDAILLNNTSFKYSGNILTEKNEVHYTSFGVKYSDEATKFIYNDKDQLIEKISHYQSAQSNYETEKKEVYIYNEFDSIAHIIFYNKVDTMWIPDIKEINHFDGLGTNRITKTKEIYGLSLNEEEEGNPLPAFGERYEYNDKGLLSKYEFLFFNGREYLATEEIVYEYDDDNNVIKAKRSDQAYSPGGLYTRSSISAWNYDSCGNISDFAEIDEDGIILRSTNYYKEEKGQSGIGTVSINPFKVYVKNNSLIVNAENIKIIDVYTLTGKQIVSTKESSISGLQKGAYLVTVTLENGSKQTTKVIF